MRASILVYLVVLGSLTLRAQQPPAAKLATGSTGATQNPSAQGVKVRGCIVGDKRLTFVQEGTGAMFRLTGGDSQFEKYRSKLTEVSLRSYHQVPSPARTNSPS